MLKRLHLLFSLILALGFSYSGLAQAPVNDLCADAIAISSETIDFAFTTIDSETDGPDHPTDCVSSGSTGAVLWNDVWYLYTPDYTGTAEFTTCSTADFDTKIAIYGPGSACPPEDGDLIGCDEDGAGCSNSTSYAQFDVTSGMTYLLRLGGWGDGEPGQEGSGTFTVREFDPVAPPINDDCANATNTTATSGRSFTTIGATTDGPDHPNDCVSGGSTGTVTYNDVWFKFTPAFTGMAEFSTCGSANYDTKIAVYGPGYSCPPTDGELIACSEDGDDCEGFTSYATFDVTQGEEYLLRIGGYGNGAPGESGFGFFAVREVGSASPPENDDCSNAIALDLGDDDFVELTFSTIDANTSPPYYTETISCFDVPNGETAAFHDVWYSWTSTFTGYIEFSNCGSSNFDSRISVYGPDASCTPAGESLVGCSDDGIDEVGESCGGFTSRTIFEVEEGGNYLFQIGGFNGNSSGTGSFIVRRTTPPNIPPNDDCVNADTAYVITAQQADDFEVAFLGYTNNGTIEGPTPTCQSSGEFLDVFFKFNSGLNTEIELRFNKVGGTEFYVDLFQSCIELPVDGPNFCIDTDGQDQLFSIPMEGFPGTPTDYILRVSSRITSDPAGEFWLQLVGEPYIVGVEDIGVTNFNFFPNPVLDNATVQFELKERTDARFEILNILGQVIDAENLGTLVSGKHNFEVELDKLDTGIYFFRLQMAEEYKTIKFIKD